MTLLQRLNGSLRVTRLVTVEPNLSSISWFLPPHPAALSSSGRVGVWRWPPPDFSNAVISYPLNPGMPAEWGTTGFGAPHEKPNSKDRLQSIKLSSVHFLVLWETEKEALKLLLKGSTMSNNFQKIKNASTGCEYQQTSLVNWKTGQRNENHAPKAAQRNKKKNPNLTLYALTVYSDLSKLNIREIKKTLIKGNASKPASEFGLKFNLTFVQLISPGISKKQDNMVCFAIDPQHILLGDNSTATRPQLTLLNGQCIELQVNLSNNC